MSHELLPGVQDGHDVVGVLVLEPIVRLGLEERLHLGQVLTLLQQRDGVVLTPERKKKYAWKRCTKVF